MDVSKVIGETEGQIKLGGLVCAIISICCLELSGGYTFASERQMVFWYSLVVCMSITIALLLCAVFGVENDYLKSFDQIFHLFGAVLMIVISIIYLSSIWYWYYGSRGDPARKSSGFFALFYGLCLAAVAYMTTKGG